MIKISYREEAIPKGYKGWIDPDGITIPLDDSFDIHGKWFVKHYKKLKKRHPSLPELKDIEAKTWDEYRDLLLPLGWVHVYGIRDLMVERLDEKRRTNIVDALLLRNLNTNYPLRIYENYTDSVYILREEEMIDKGIDGFTKE
jgi:hypothetical protein